MDLQKLALYYLTTSAMMLSLISSCSKSGSGSSDPQNVGPTPFQSEVYRSLDGSATVTITSPEDVELTRNGINLICKYTRQTGGIRVVATVNGTPQAIYFRTAYTRLLSPEGTELLNPEAYAVELKAKAEKAARLQESRVASRTVQTFSLPVNGNYNATPPITTISISDVGLTVQEGRKNAPFTLYFSDLRSVSKVSICDNNMKECEFTLRGPKEVLVRNLTFVQSEFVTSKAEYEMAVSVITSTYREWAKRYPDFVLWKTE